MAGPWCLLSETKLKDLIMNTIVVKWVPEEGFGYGHAMYVVASDHERFYMGTRFDYGFFSIATREGYIIISLPPDPPVKNDEEQVGA